MSIPARYTIASDTFQRADENPLSDGGIWKTITGKLALKIVSHFALPAGVNNGSFMVWSSGTFPQNQWAQETVASYSPPT